jgi:uncharacterized protein YndB with AHSA1/START domain
MSPRPPRPHVGRAVRREIRIAVPPRAVWDAWAEPEEIARWFVDRAEGSMRDAATVTWRFEAFGFSVPVEIFAAVPGEYLAFGGALTGRPPALQEVILEHRGGETLLRVVNSGFGDGAQWDEEYEGVDSGWVMALATLKHQLERYPGRSRHHLLAVRPTALDFAALQPRLATEEGLRRWLAREARLSSDPLELGTRVELDLGEAGPLAGEVLARSRREALLSWPQRSAVLGLKCFTMGPAGKQVALDWSGWAPGPAPAELQPWLDAAAARLAGPE